MKYNLIELRKQPEILGGKWQVKYDNTDPYNRMSRRSYKPDSDLGFFYYPRKWGPQKGFDVLKQSMIEARQNMIDALQRQIDELNELQLPNWAKSTT
jgi:hypothetical protein